MSTPPPPIPLPSYVNAIDNLRDRSESTARNLCIGLGILFAIALACTVFAGIIVLVLSFIYWIVTFVVAAHIKGGAIQVTAKSWPELNAIVDEAKNKLGVSDAKAYVIQDSVFNAFATRLAGRNFVVLNSGAIDTLLRKGKIEDLKFLVGHECGHVAMGHVGFWNTSFAHLGAIIYPLYAWYRRCQERSADRCGLWCAGNRTDAHTSIAVLAGGSEMGSRLDINAVSAQWNEVRDETWIMIARYYSEYPHTLERILLVHQAADELRLP